MEHAVSARNYLTKNFLLVTAVMLFSGAVGEAFNPLMPQFAVELGAPLAVSGLSTTICGTASMLFRPVAGQLLDRLGRKKIALGGMALHMAAFVVYLYTTSFLGLLWVRFFQGIAVSIISTALCTIITDVVPPEHLTEGMALSNVAGAISMSVGPALGLWIKEVFGMQGVFCSGLILLVLSLILLLPLHYEEVTASSVEQPAQKTPGRRFPLAGMVEPAAVLPMLMLLILVIGQTVIYNFLPQIGQQYGLKNVGIFFVATAVGIIYTRMFIGPIILRFTEQAIVVFGVSTFFVCIGVFAVQVSYLTLLLSGLLFGFGYGGVVAVFNGMALAGCPPHRRGAANATYYMGFDLGFATGSLLWGVVIGRVGYQTAFLTAACLTLLTLPVYFFIYRPRYRRNL